MGMWSKHLGNPNPDSFVARQASEGALVSDGIVMIIYKGEYLRRQTDYPTVQAASNISNQSSIDGIYMKTKGEFRNKVVHQIALGHILFT
ncbi:hypothetical protein AVEN_150876-1 [Araneus ventricosus]|uniref:Uncharacterized protein n=1 Tax=Araneus ventricosus TaxID=182803 RepID=A0A4Y2R0P4_ARAVE|nr:hypothetical protein AVEN_150876-1 [Araneus ventricosus]